MKYSNPILPGFYPDPSICKHKDKYYMVHSTFQYFPGVTLFESVDLINFNQIGHVLTRESQLPLEEAGPSGGIFAPTIRVHNDRFYMVTTNVSTGGNFYVYTDDIYGEWSEPIYIDQDGIDPSFYFEGDTCYFMSNGTDDDGNAGVTQCEIDIETGKIISKRRVIWTGTGGRYLEGPHLYKIGDKYCLLAAEGGTEYGHMIIAAYGDTPYGPFEGVSNNPILTNRNLGGYEIQGCGHGDFVEGPNGEYYMVHLAFRQTDRWMMYHTTGRETYLVGVKFEEDKILCGDKGTTRLEMEIDDKVAKKQNSFNFEKTFTSLGFENEWVYLRKPNSDNYVFNRNEWILKGCTDSLDDSTGKPTFIATRQLQMEGFVTVNLSIREGEAGVTIYMDNDHHYDIALVKEENDYYAVLRTTIGNAKAFLGSVLLSREEVLKGVSLNVLMKPLEYEFYVDNRELGYLGKMQSRYLSTEVAGGFTGVMIGLYSLEGSEGRFRDFSYKYEK